MSCSRLHAQDVGDNHEITRMLFVFDASQSMAGRWQSDIKFNIARRLFVKMLDSLKSVPDLQIALRVYGHQHHYPPQVCTDSKLEVPFGNNNVQRIKEVLKQLRPNGTTPIAYSLEQSVNDFPACENCRNIVVLITDGIEECGGDPCAVSLKLQQQGIFLRPFVIGVGGDFSRAFECVGTYLDASTEDNFRSALDIVVTNVLNKTSAQVNILDAYGNPRETDVVFSIIENRTGKTVRNYVQTLNHKGVPDTINIDPLKVYDLLVHTVPPKRTDSIVLQSGIHNYLPAEAATGYLRIKEKGKGRFFTTNVSCLIRQHGKNEILTVQDLGQTERYRTGVYDIEVLVSPRFNIENVVLSQNHTTIVEVPSPGYAAIKYNAGGKGALFQVQGNNMIWIKNIDVKNPDTELYPLMPGYYKIVWRSVYAHRILFTFERDFEVRSGLTTGIEAQFGGR